MAALHDLGGQARSRRAPRCAFTISTTLLVLLCTSGVGCQRALTADQVLRTLKSAPLDRYQEQQLRIQAPRDPVLLPSLVAALRDPEPATRRAAVAALEVARDRRATEPLISALHTDPDEYVRERALTAVASFDDSRITGALVASLIDEASNVRRQAARLLASRNWHAANVTEQVHYCIASYDFKGLSEIGAPGLEALVALLAHKDSTLRSNAAAALSKIDDPRVADVMMAALEDRRGARGNAVAFLARTGDSRAVVPMLAVLQDADPKLRRQAASFLAKMKDPRAAQPMTDALKDADGDVRRSAAEYLRGWNDPRVVGPMIDALEDGDPAIRAVAAYTLGVAGDRRAIEPLVGNLPDWYSNVWVAEALAKLGWVPRSPEEKVRYWVARRNLKELNRDPMVTREILTKDLDSPDHRTFQNALFALVAGGNSHDVEALIAKLQSRGDAGIATAYLNSGNDRLAKAAREWAGKHGFVERIFGGQGRPSPVWGRFE